MTKLTPEQLKGRLKSLASRNNTDARVLLRLFMMERFLERLSLSRYSEMFVLKGGMLISSMAGISVRSTMDVDTTISGFDLNPEEAVAIVSEIIAIELDDGVSFSIEGSENIMDAMDYPGIRIEMTASMEKITVPFKIDISTGDVVTPSAIKYNYKTMIEDHSINLCSYNIETVLAEKIQTILARGALNTRMRDFYDVKILMDIYKYSINHTILRKAFEATSRKRKTETLIDNSSSIIKNINEDKEMNILWNKFQSKYKYASEISFKEVLDSVTNTIAIIQSGIE